MGVWLGAEMIRDGTYLLTEGGGEVPFLRRRDFLTSEETGTRTAALHTVDFGFPVGECPNPSR